MKISIGVVSRQEILNGPIFGNTVMVFKTLNTRPNESFGDPKSKNSKVRNFSCNKWTQ